MSDMGKDFIFYVCRNWVSDALKPLLSGFEFVNLLCLHGNTLRYSPKWGTMENNGLMLAVEEFLACAAGRLTNELRHVNEAWHIGPLRACYISQKLF